MRDGRELLGEGAEGIVYRDGPEVVKRFRPGAMDRDHVAWLQRVLPRLADHLPGPCRWRELPDGWEVRYPWEETQPLERLEREPLLRFLGFCLRQRVVCANFKLSNLRLRAGELFFVDIGAWVVPFDTPYFTDMCARAFLLHARGLDDDALQRLTPSLREPGALERVEGLDGFFRELMAREAARFLATAPSIDVEPARPRSADVTLLIKACAMDAATVDRQVVHLTRQLGMPQRFAEVVVAVDTRERDFVRQHTAGDLPLLLNRLDALVRDGVVDRVLVAPSDIPSVSALNRRWFGVSCDATHTCSGVPVHPQLWAFERVRTRWVLQCDVDVLVGRSDPAHDYLSDMLRAAAPDDVVGVAFNIPFPPELGFRPYDAPRGAYVPEVRCGLLDLDRIRALLPIRNAVVEGALAMTWYRALEAVQRERGLRTLRGGDPRTWYVHPPNTAKRVPQLVEHVRTAIEAGGMPRAQLTRWDIVEDASAWELPPRLEDVVFLVMGGAIPIEKVVRCFRSLLAQDSQEYGVIVVEDGGSALHAARVHAAARSFGDRASIVCNVTRQGRLANKWRLVPALVRRLSTMVVVLDMDDFLIRSDVVDVIRAARVAGYDVVSGGSFRPDKPLKPYPIDFPSAARHRGSGNVWVHLRCFTRRAFGTLTREDLTLDGEWISDCSDYATMVPMVRRTSRHLGLREYLHVHERSTVPDVAMRKQRKVIIDAVLARNA